MIKLPLTINEIKRFLPHRSPFLLIDKVTAFVPYERCTAYKAVSYDEWFFKGHFPDHPVMPGVLIVEAMAQSAGVLAVASITNNETPSNMLFASISNVRFRRQVIPGDLLRLEISVESRRAKFWKFNGKAFVEDLLATEADFTAMLP